MLTKLAFKNIYKNFRDYSVYIFTLVLSVSIFYMFNSIFAQGVMLKLSQDIMVALSGFNKLTYYISLFVSIVLGLLMVFANNFFMRARKKELGIYLTLGMKPKDIIVLITTETFLLALFALGFGLLFGTLLSQVMSLITANLFDADLRNYQFVFSMDAAVRTLVNYGVMFLTITLFNAVSIGRTTMVKLLAASKKGERLVFNTPVSIVLFLISVGLLYYSRHAIVNSTLLALPTIFGKALIAGCLATFLFYASVMKFLTILGGKIQSFYYRGLNMFVLRQLNSKIATSFLSMSVVSICLLIATMIFSSGYAVQQAFKTINENEYAYDLSLSVSFESKAAELLPEKDRTGIRAAHEYTLYKYYLSDFVSSPKNDVPVWLIGLEDYNALLHMKGRQPIALAADEYTMVTSNMGTLNAHKELRNGIQLKGGSLHYADLGVNLNVRNNSSGVVLVVPQQLASGSEGRNVAVMDFVSKEAAQNALDSIENLKDVWDYDYYSKIDFATESLGVRGLVAYVSLYMGFVFMISGSLIIALQQLSEANEKKQRYRVLSNLGANRRMIGRALFMQTFLYFFLPLIVAVYHAFTTMRLIQEVAEFGNMSYLYSTALYSALTVLLIYGIYFVLTYVLSKRIIYKN